ncbi:MAG TPA: polysaccharide biosynthesis/export family protein, partial [Limnochordales bacterium]
MRLARVAVLALVTVFTATALSPGAGAGTATAPSSSGQQASPAGSGAPSGSPAGSLRPGPYRLGPGDVLAIGVWGYPDLTSVVEVRPDGYVAFPLVGEVLAEGLTPGELAAVLGEGLRQYVREPRVTVSLQQMRSIQASILGAVRNPGTYPMRYDARVSDLVGRAGGLLDEADPKGAVLTRTRPDGSLTTMRLDLEAILQGASPPPSLAAGDVVYVPPARPAVVLGAVNSPGQFRVRSGMRVLELLAAAGGLQRRADPAGAVLTRHVESASARSFRVNLQD